MIAAPEFSADVKDGVANCIYDFNRSGGIPSRLPGIGESKRDGGAGHSIIAIAARPGHYEGVKICNGFAFFDARGVAAER